MATEPQQSRYAVYASRVGPVAVVFTPEGLRAVTPIDRLRRRGRGTVGTLIEAPFPDDWDAPLRLTLEEGQVTGVPLDYGSMTSFRRSVLEATRTIERGTTTTYAELATSAGRPGAVRAATTALAHNPLPLVVPCHRVVVSEDDVGGYVLGAELKEQLLTEEAAS